MPAGVLDSPDSAGCGKHEYDPRGKRPYGINHRVIGALLSMPRIEGGHSGRWPPFAIQFSVSRIADSLSLPALSRGFTGNRGAPTGTPVMSSPALIVLGKPPLRMKSSKGNCR